MIELVIIDEGVFSIVKREMRRARLTETGGALVGHHQGHYVVVTSASGPGPKAELRMHSVMIDGAHAERFCSKARRKSKGTEDYIGDWHCHLGYSLKPSKLDYNAMKTMAEFSSAQRVIPFR